MSSKKHQIPAIRFKGFTGAWEQRKWSETVDISTEMVNPKTGEYDSLPHIGPGNIESFTGRILDNVKSVKEDNLISGKFHFYPGDVIYGKINPQLGKYAMVDFEGLASADSYVLNTKNGVSQTFLFTILQGTSFYKYSVSVSMRTGMPKINRDELNQYSYSAPSVVEQEKIGHFFKQLDDTIALHQRQLDNYKQLKKSILQKIFKQELRYKDENGNDYPDWQMKSLKDVVEFVRNGLSLPQNEKKIGFKVTRIETISLKEVNLEKVGFIDSNTDVSEYKLVPGDILFSNINSVAHIGKVAYIYKDYDIYHGMNLLCIRPNTDIDPYFLYINLDLSKSKLFFEKICNQAVNQASINQTELMKMIIEVPCLEEQVKISRFVEKLESRIKAYEINIELLKENKKGLMQQMFV